ncbi:MAG: hypothetical protein QF718_04300 [Phycisphaerales bacterium]|jgi:hypothetical protein|nr:hypothetical protein [Phycisphaerales bacterium]
MESWIKSGLIIIAMAIVGFTGVWLASWLFSPRGSLGPTILQSISPIKACFAVLITVGIASVIGGFIARISTTISGMFVLGFSLFAMAMKLEGVEELIYSGGSFYILIIEALFLSIVVLIGTLIVFAIGGPLKDVAKPDGNNGSNFWRAVLISLAVLPVIWLVAKSPMKGQVIGSAAVGGIAIGFLARQFTPSLQPVIYYVLPISVGGFGYFIGITLFPVSDVAFAQQSLSQLLFPMPIEYAAGVIMGLSIGLSWAASLSEKPNPEKHKKVAL